MGLYFSQNASVCWVLQAYAMLHLYKPNTGRKLEMPDLKVEQAAQELGISKFKIYRLPKGTPGLYKYGKALRVNVTELRAWARSQQKKSEEA